MPLIKRCKSCGKEFARKSYNQLYCSYDCKQKGRNKKKPCLHCGKSFETPHTNTARFCSRGCSELYAGRRVALECAACGIVFYRKKSHTIVDNKAFCSKKCHDNSMRKIIKKTCLHCGKEFVTNPNSRSKIYCDKKCMADSKRTSIPYQTIYDLYVVKKLNTRDIGEKLEVSKHKISDTLKYYAIPIRDGYTQRKGHEYSIPTKDELENLYINEYMSYAEIGKIYDTELSNVGIWLKKYGIKPRKGGESKRGKAFIMPTKEQIKELYIDKELTSYEIATLFNASSAIVCKVIKGYGFETRPNIWLGRKFIKCKDRHEVRSSFERIVDDYLCENNIEHTYEKRLPGAFYRYMTDFYAKDTYIEIWGVLNSEKYEEKKKKKEQAYKELKLRLISLTPQDFKDLDMVYKKLQQIS